jgi:tRNA-dihydrouridine synthase B
MLRIGPHVLDNNLVLAPMAGVTDKPFRMLCKRLGAGLCVSEMTISDPRFWGTSKSLHRMDHAGEPAPISVQIAGTEPEQLAVAAKYNVDHGAQIIDINMGCPAKKVCNAWAGSALMRDEPRVARILEAVVRAVDVPVTLKIRTGWDATNRNALTIARIAQESGIAALAVHGRTREQGFLGLAEYDTIAAVKAALRVPVVANGDIDSAAKARAVLAHTRADALMIGRAAQGRPWIFRDIAHELATGRPLPPPATADVRRWLVEHLHDHYALHGEWSGVRSARKHIGWAVRALPGGEAFRAAMNTLDSCAAQVEAVATFFDRLGERHVRLPSSEAANQPALDLAA